MNKPNKRNKMKEKQFAIVGSNKYDDLLKMRILEVFKCSDENKTILAWKKWRKRYKYCYIVQTVYG